MNILLQKELDKIDTLLDITEYQMYQFRDIFYEDMKNKTMLKMIPTFTYCNMVVPDGEYLAIDFGGTNVRCYRYEVKNKNIEIQDSVSFSLITETEDYTNNEHTLEDILNLIVDKLETIIDKEKQYFLGHTFSFAARSLSKNSAIVIDMAKGFNLRDAQGVDVNQLLANVINKRKLKIKPISIINDTTATLLTGNYLKNNADIALIVGTGHNACFKSESGEIVNIESAYMSKGIPLSYFDFNLIDKLPGTKDTILEVLTGGKYLGLIAQEIINELFEAGFLSKKLIVNSVTLTEAAADKLSDEYNAEEKEVLKQVSIMIFKRTAKLLVSEISAILMYIDEDMIYNHSVVFDGSVYEKNKILQDYVKTYLEKIYGDTAKKIETFLIKDASSLGAVISIFPLTEQN